MENSVKYNFSDFTTDHYRQLLIAAKEHYTFRGYNDFSKDEKFALWRHDVDLSPQRALRLAEIEAEEGVKTTYFWHLHSEYYNLFEKTITDIVKKIIDLGHYCGLHFDTHFHGITSEKDLEEGLRKEQEILEWLTGYKIGVFSFHNTNPFIMSCQNWQYGGLVNTYAAYFQKEVPYCSDSNGYWRFKRMYDVLSKEENPCVQMLTHPEWWQESIMSPWQRIETCIDGRASSAKKFYIDTLHRINNKNVDWDRYL